MAKPLFASKTIWGATLSGLASLAVIFAQPGFYKKAAGCAQQFDQTELADSLLKIAPAIGVASSAVAFFGRFSLGDLYTRDGIIGPNKADVVAKEMAPIIQVQAANQEKQAMQSALTSTQRELDVVKAQASVNPLINQEQYLI